MEYIPIIYYNGRSPSFRIADTHEKDGFWIFAFAQDPPKNNIFIFQEEKHLVSSLKMRPPPAGTCDGRASPHT